MGDTLKVSVSDVEEIAYKKLKLPPEKILLLRAGLKILYHKRKTK